jgi:uncharacterized membrane protein YoaK (UPF0700 family)
LLPAVLSMTAGSVDVIGFLALGGLFTAHISGNLCILAAHFITGRFSRNGPLLSVPLFIAVLALVTWAFGRNDKASNGWRRTLLILHAVPLAACLAFGVWFGPFADVERPMAVLVGMLAVTAMATQNALGKLTLPDTPPTAVMTTNITQLTMDVATLAWGRSEPDNLADARRRAGVTLPCVLAFVGGCTAGAVLEVHFGFWALALPVGLAALAVPLGELRSDGRVGHGFKNAGNKPNKRRYEQTSRR